ncbi:protein dopey-1 homolog isoform X2 [Agrilus planipennis]|uniref:Protein dopey-1 homolog isoform X2 n=1 Tax=Agrilus planipennis TaxID=224129 RepID=A0A7F5RM10_AGRPL|nr:protein dopey-1 homolog isoform X2 [Agrilus planipennis]
MTTIAMEEYELLKDSKYRMYVVAVDKALKSFEYTSEWPDLISALGKLNKVLQGYTKFPVIPRRIKISKRLAQCMHPALPSGVHLKALETYDIIFKCMGTNRLAHELFIYSAGLFPLLGHAAMTIRPVLLQLYETHFVPLRERLRPALSGFLSGVLPGLETGSDHFDRTNNLLEAVCEGVGPEWFYTCMWQCVRSNSPIRLPAISYVLTHYSRKLTMEDQLYLMGNDIDVMVSGLCAAVQDSSVLVQRSALDLLMACFPIHNTQLLYADMVRLVTSALTSILRRDMSLNRRLYSWLLGSEINVSLLHSEHPLIKKLMELPDSHSHVEAYFELYSYDILTEAVKITLSQSSTEVPIDIKPYRLLTSLLDKPQIGPVILDGILYDIFRALYLSCFNYQKHKNHAIRCVSFNGDISSLKGCEKVLTKKFVTNNCQELVKNANLLFSTLEPYYIWMYLGKLYEEAIGKIKEKKNMLRDRSQVNEIGSGPPSLLEVCALTDFLLDVVHIETFSENTSEILPNLFINVITSMKLYLDALNKLEIMETLQLCTKILKKIQPVTVAQVSKKDTSSSVPNKNEKEPETNFMKPGELESPTVEDEESLNEVSEIKQRLEKSKSDSKINENYSKNELTVDTTSRERSNSNQMLKKKTSPKIDKKSKNKKSKSSSKLYDLKKDGPVTLDNLSVDSKDLTVDVETVSCPSPTKTECKHVTRCLDTYKKFFVKFLHAKVIQDIDVEDYFQSLIQNSEKRTEELEKLLSQCLDLPKDFEPLNPKNILIRTHVSDANLSGELLEGCSDYEQVVSVACNLLSEFSSFPNLPTEKSDPTVIPYWLKALITCACHPEKPSKDIQLVAMSTLLDNFSLTKSQKIVNNSEENTNVLVMGILEINHVIFIEDCTFILEIMSQILWDLLRFSPNQNQLVLCVTLLYQIHNIFDKKCFVENVIGRYLVSDNLTTDFFKRFSILWHLGRDLSLNIPNQNKTRNFDRCILKILDNLENTKKPNLKLLSDTFLTHCLLRNDIARLINPIFTVLLMPSTARISIRYVNFTGTDLHSDSEMQNEETEETINAKKVFAVSNINGNLIYHSTSNKIPKPMKRKSFLFSKANRKAMGMSAINTTASISENEGIITKKNKDFKGSEGISGVDTVVKSNVKLFINPLGSKEIYPDGVDGSYTQIDPNESSQQTSSESLSSGKNGEAFEKGDRDSGFGSHSSYTSNKSISESATKPAENEAEKPLSRTKLPKSHSLDEKIDAEKEQELENGALVHSWSYCLSDSDKFDCELEISTTAEEFFKTSDRAIVTELLNEILDRVCPSETFAEGSAPKTNIKNVDFDLKPKIVEPAGKNLVVFPIHKHLCLYYEPFETSLVIYALNTLKNSLLSNPQLFIQCLATTGLKTLKIDLLNLLARHRKSLFGLGFSGDVPQEHLNFYRGYMFLDVLISVCLYYVRSFFPNLDSVKVTDEDIDENLKIQLISLEILSIVVKHLINIVMENKKGFSSYIADMLIKCKMQKTLLHCLLTSVRSFDEDLTFAEETLLYNKFQLYDTHRNVSEYIEAFQVQTLRLIENLIILEYHVFPVQEASSVQQQQSQQPQKDSSSDSISFKTPVLIPDQQIFLSAILSALRHQNMKNLHENWCNMVTACLPYFRQNLKTISINVIHQICNNIEKISENYNKANDLEGGELCPDYAVTQLNLLTVICHYCLLDSTQLAVQQQQQPKSGTNGNNNLSTTNGPNPGEILTNLVNAFFSPAAADVSRTNKQNSDHYLTARKTTLGHMPRIISSVAKLWQTIVSLEREFNGILGNSKVVKQQLLEFLSPISVHHGSSFLAAVAVAWYERRNPLANIKSVLPEPNAVQSNLVYLISAIRVIPLDNLVQTVTAVIRYPPPTEGLSADICLDVSILELFYCYMRNASATQLSEAWSSLLTLIREGCALSPPSQFLLAALLHELMIKCCPLEERKDQKDLQDVTAKLIECVSQVCGSCLEQTTWLRRNLAVKEQEDDSVSSNGLNSTSPEILTGTNYSVQAQLVLSEILAPILDICFGSSEKDKVNTILTSLMCNIVPYLKTHTLKNMPSFNACSKLLSSLSSYQYTRKAWKKDVFELLLDNNLFQMDTSCLKYWKVIVDNLMTHDNTTFKDLMSRVSMPQSGSLNLFSSREQEYEQKAQLLKRLAFVIFCSEVDQYAKYMADIQEQLTSSLRLNVPGIQAQVFLCFRVILIRMSPIHVTSLWPIIISEMLQVFLQIEQELATDTEEFSSHIKLLSALDASWATNSSNGLHALGHPHWLRLQLATAKLLDLALLLPAIALPQFQMYRWAFVGDNSAHIVVQNPLDSPTFVPHVTRIANLMDQRFADTQIETLPTKPNELLLTANAVTQLKDLHSFFKTLSLCSNRHRTECNAIIHGDQPFQDRQVDKKVGAIMEKIDRVIENDFLDKIPR